MNTELLDLEDRYTRLLNGGDVDFSEPDIRRLFVLRKTESKNAAEAKRRSELRGVDRIREGLL